MGTPAGTQAVRVLWGLVPAGESSTGIKQTVLGAREIHLQGS